MSLAQLIPYNVIVDGYRASTCSLTTRASIRAGSRSWDFHSAVFRRSVRSERFQRMWNPCAVFAAHIPFYAGSKGAQGFAHASSRESRSARIVHAEIGERFIWKDPCIQTDGHTGFNELAAGERKGDRESFLTQ